MRWTTPCRTLLSNSNARLTAPCFMPAPRSRTALWGITCQGTAASYMLPLATAKGSRTSA
eukprot:4336632-Heterocapsa_arctica.AAC.1